MSDGNCENMLPGALKARRGHRSLREVAEEIGVSAATLWRIENGSTPRMESYTKISAWLNQSDDLRDYRIEIRATGIVRTASAQEARELALRSIPAWGVQTSFSADPHPYDDL